MSARAILSDNLKIVEIDMQYHEREGESKLKLWKDGIRFFKVIVEAIFLYRPSRPLAMLGILLLFIAGGLIIRPTIYYLENHKVLEWMIYRFVVSDLLVTTGFLLLCASFLSEKIVRMTMSASPSGKPHESFLEKFFSSGYLWVVPVLCFLLGGVLVFPSFLELVRTGATYEHWSRFLVMSFLFSIASILIVVRLLHYTLNLIAARMEYLRSYR